MGFMNDVESLCENACFYVRFLNEAPVPGLRSNWPQNPQLRTVTGLKKEPAKEPEAPPPPEDPTKAHPKLAKARQDLKKAVDWVADGLEKNGTPEMKRLAQELKKLPELPSERVMPSIQEIQPKLYQAMKLQARVEPAKAKAVKDAMEGIPFIMKMAGALEASSMSDKGLYAKKESAWQMANEAHVLSSDPEDIVDALKSQDKVALSFPDDRSVDSFASRLAAKGLRKNVDFFIEPEGMELKSRSLLDKGGGVASEMAKELEKMSAGLSIDPNTAPAKPGFWRK